MEYIQCSKTDCEYHELSTENNNMCVYEEDGDCEDCVCYSCKHRACTEAGTTEFEVEVSWEVRAAVKNSGRRYRHTDIPLTGKLTEILLQRIYFEE